MAMERVMAVVRKLASVFGLGVQVCNMHLVLVHV